MKTLSLFNAVVIVTEPQTRTYGAFHPKYGPNFFVSTSETLEYGYIIEPNAMWAKDRIIAYYAEQRLSGNDLNKTFYKSWEKVRSMTRFEIYLDQIVHYFSTYGTNFQAEMYIPEGVLDVPDLKLSFKVIKAYTKEEMTEKCLDILRSGIALKEETINDVLTVLTDELRYTFTGDEGVRNKEAVIKIADMYGILPTDIMEFFRYIVYRATDQSLLIKSPEVIETIKKSNFNPGAHFNKFGLEKLAEIFNRFKPLFLAFKNRCPQTINKISKLSKVHHKPLVTNPLNLVTQSQLTEDQNHWLDNATPFALFKSLTACNDRVQGQTEFVYRIRNGKSWCKSSHSKYLECSLNYNILFNYIVKRFNLKGKKIFLPKNVEYALPTSEKMFVGNIPTGTKFYGERLAIGMYWENSWGAHDIDLSSMDIGGNKVGWNARYQDGPLTYSGDITNAPNGAVEYLHSNRDLSNEWLIMTNIYSGDINSGYKIVIGEGDDVSKKYMMDPNKVLAEIRTESIQKSTILGMLMPEKLHNVSLVSLQNKQSFTLLNFGSGNARVSGRHSQTGITALKQQWSNPISFNNLLLILGAEIVDEPEKADIDYSLDKLDKDSFIKLFLEKVG